MAENKIYQRKFIGILFENIKAILLELQTSTDSDELVRRLEGDKERLSLQVTVLTEQIDAQTEKIADLEKALEDKKKQIHTAEDVLNRVRYYIIGYYSCWEIMMK